MSLKTYSYKCPEHGVFPASVEFDDRETPQPCPECGADSKRTWQDAGPMPLRASYRDGKKRFNGAREASQLKQEAAKARKWGNLDEDKRIKKEIKKLGDKTK